MVILLVLEGVEFARQVIESYPNYLPKNCAYCVRQSKKQNSI